MTSYAFCCKVSGLIHSRHNESCNSLVWLACAGFQPSNVRDEPHTTHRDNERKYECKKLTESQTEMHCEINSDLCNILIRGFWDSNTDCIIDVRICNVNQASYLTRKPASIVQSAENEKKKKYLEPCLEQRRHFTPFVISCEGLLGKEADIFLKHLSMKFAEK